MKIRWTTTDADGRPQKFAFVIAPGQSVRIGRGEDQDLRLAGEGVSRAHAEIVATPKGVAVRDVGSSNGTRLDDRPVTQAVWRPGQRLQVGSFTLELDVGAKAPSEARPDRGASVGDPHRARAATVAQATGDATVKAPPDQGAGDGGGSGNGNGRGGDARQLTLLWKTDGGGTERRTFDYGALISVGRGEDQDIVLRDDQASRAHTQLRVRSNRVQFRDLQSINGTWLDGVRIGEGDWRLHQKLRIGRTIFSIEVSRLPTYKVPGGDGTVKAHPSAKVSKQKPGQIGLLESHDPASPILTPAEARKLEYRAFISYSHDDKEIAAKLFQRLENYKVLPEFHGQPGPMGPVPGTLHPLFLDRETFHAGRSLGDQTRRALHGSGALIVVCSPSAAASHYVNQEIQLFRQMHPRRPIIPVIVAGEPYGGEGGCYPPALQDYSKLPDDGGGMTSILGADLRKGHDEWRLALDKIVATLIGLPVFKLRERQEKAWRRSQFQWYFGGAAASVVVIASLTSAFVFGVFMSSDDRARSEAKGVSGFQNSGVALTNNEGDSKELAARELGLSKDQVESGVDGFELLKKSSKTMGMDKIKRRAKRGDGTALYLLGLAHWEGIEVTKDIDLAIEYMTKAVTAREFRAATSLGYYHCCQAGGPNDERSAVRWFNIGVDNNVPGSMFNLAIQYRDGRGVERDLVQAEKLFERSAKRGKVAGFNNIAWLYRDRRYNQVNYDKAIKFHERAIAAGYVDGAVDLAGIYRWGFNGKKDRGEALEVLRRGGNKGCKQCFREIGNILSDPQSGPVDEASATAAFIQGAEAGDTESMLQAGRRLNRGTGVEKPDPVAGFGWLDKAREAGLPEAVGAVGLALARGEGKERDDERAATYLREALAFQDDPATRFKIWPPNYWGFGKELAKLHEEKRIDGASDARAIELYNRYGSKNASLKRFTVPVDCGGATKTPFDIYVTDWGRNEPSTDEQAEWLKVERGCTMPQDVIESFRKLFKIAKDNNVLFTDLTVYALGTANKENEAEGSTGEGKSGDSG